MNKTFILQKEGTEVNKIIKLLFIFVGNLRITHVYLDLQRPNHAITIIILPFIHAFVCDTAMFSWERFTGFVDIFEYKFDIAIVSLWKLFSCYGKLYLPFDTIRSPSSFIADSFCLFLRPSPCHASLVMAGRSPFAPRQNYYCRLFF